MKLQSRHITFFQWCKRYVSFTLIVAVGVMAYLLFFTDTSIPETYRYDREVQRLKAEIKAETDTLEYYRELNRRIASDPVTLERVAREQYHMQRPHEDVYVVTPE
ncbi:MAG: septum formation initiator family protein [Paramuribaculum sp.]|nr:septum formation initiator family protein [Paramuribaculum sp.]